MSRSRTIQAAPKTAGSSVKKEQSVTVLSTPVFTNSSLGKNSTYIQELSRKYHALSKVVHEDPPSPSRLHPFSAQHLAEQQRRVDALRVRVQEAWVEADGNPADGKWVFLPRLLQLGVTSGRRGRFMGARLDVKSPEELEGLEWINASTEPEWKDWERRFKQEKRVKDKVESWKRKVDDQVTRPAEVEIEVEDLTESAPTEPPPIPSKAPISKSSEATTATKVDSDAAKLKTTALSKPRVTSKSSVQSRLTNAKASSSAAADPLKDTAPFGFGVVKHSSQQSVVNGKPGAGARNSNVPKEPPVPSSPAHQRRENKAAGQKDDTNQAQATAKPTLTKDIRDLSDIPEMSFLPPSFPGSQLLTSTPKPNTKPPPISSKLSAAPPASSSPLPPLTSSLSALPSSPTRKPVSKISNSMKPPPVPSPSSSPRVMKTYGRHNLTPSPGNNRPLETSASLPALPTTPTRQTHPKTTFKPLSKSNDRHDHNDTTEKEAMTSNQPNANNKRVLDAEDGRKVKKARTLPTVPSSTSALPLLDQRVQPTASPSPTTPRRTVAHITPSSPTTPKKVGDKPPTLVELLASAKKAKKAERKERERLKLLEARESAPAVAVVEEGVEKFFVIDPGAADIAGHAVHHEHGGDDDFNATLSLDVNAGNIHHMDIDLDPGYTIDPIVNDFDNDQFELELASPTKSLSSIADSDEEDDEEDQLPNDGGMDLSFKPLATSTQVQPEFVRGRGPFVSKANVSTTPEQQRQSGGTGKGESQGAGTDSWASVYATASRPPGSSNPNPPSAASSKKPSQASKPSSQANPHPPSSSFPYALAYNSQFESNVAAQVDRVDKLLEKDVDYEGWLKDPDVEDNEEEEGNDTEEDDEDGHRVIGSYGLGGGAGTAYSLGSRYGSGAGFSVGTGGSAVGGQNVLRSSGGSYGYGKAFVYDESA